MHMFFRKKKFRFLIISFILLLLVIGFTLFGFSIDVDGSIKFLTNISSFNSISYLTIGLGIIASIVVAIAFNFSSEASQGITRNILASPFTLGLVPIMSLSYLIGNIIPNFDIWAVGLLALGIMFFLNIIPNYFISNSKYKNSKSASILYGLSLSILVTSTITLLSYLTQGEHPNILGWMIISVATFTNTKLFYGLLFLLCGCVIFFFIIKKIHIYEHAYFKASSLTINLSLLNMLSLTSISLMCVGGFIAYAPFTLLGFAIPFITKKYLLNIYDIRFSLLPSTLLSISITLCSYIINCYLQINVDILMTLLMLPFIFILICQKKVNYVS